MASLNLLSLLALCYFLLEEVYWFTSAVGGQQYNSEQMQYILQAFSDSQPQLKSKLSKVRHLDSLFFFFLIVALIFFQIFQNHQLREELLSRKGDYLLEELIQEKIPQLQKQIQELKMCVSEENSKIVHKIDENKELTLFIGRQLGLPLRERAEEVPSVQKVDYEQSNERHNFEVIQILPNEEESESSQQTDRESQQSDYFQNTPEQEIISMQESSQSSNQFMRYLQNWEQQQVNSYEQTYLNLQKRQYRINTSNYVKFTGYEMGQKYFEEIKRWLQYFAKTVLIIILIAVVFLITFHKKSKGKQTKSSIRNLWKKICYEEKKRAIMKEQKQIQLL